MPLVKWHEGEVWFSDSEYQHLEHLQLKVRYTKQFTSTHREVPVVLVQYAEDMLMPPDPKPFKILPTAVFTAPEPAALPEPEPVESDD